MMDEYSGSGGSYSDGGDLIEIDLNFESMRRFQAEFSPNLSKGGLFIDTGEPLDPGSVVRFRVILPEDFVFLEGTAVVEWRRSAEVVSDGPPGMALRFVTLSTQNEELVEQLVQDFVNAGGTPFDLDVRPEMSDFPTDALEGAPVEREERSNEGYRLTVRGAGLSLEAEALQALADAVPDGDDDSPKDSSSIEDVASVEDAAPEVDDDIDDANAESPATPEPADEPRGFEILSGPTESATPNDPEPEEDELSAQPAEVEDIGEPPEIDWSTETDRAAVEEQDSVVEGATPGVDEPLPEVEATTEVVEEPSPEVEDTTPEIEESSPEVEAATLVVEEPSPEVEDTTPEIEESSPEAADYDSSITDVLDIPEEFADGPEVIGEVEEDLGSPAFQVSLPENDDEPDTTPVLPDEGGSDVTVPPDDDVDDVVRRRRLWPFGLAAILVLAVGAGFLRPYVKTWLETRGADVTDAAASVSTVGSTSGSVAEPIADEIAESDDVADDGIDNMIEDSPSTENVAAADDPKPERAAAADPVATADAIASIDIEAGSGGTTVRIRGNGTLEDGAVSMESLSSPPRVLVRLRGIRSVYRPFTIESGTAEVTRARIGHHEDRRPPELWVVLDLTGPQAGIGGIDIQGDLVEFVVSAR